MKNFVQKGEVMEVTLTAAASSGDFVMTGSLGGVAQVDGANGDTIGVLRCGVFTLPKATGQAWTVGARLYWSSANSNFTTTATGNTLVGVAAAAAATGDTTGTVLLDGAAR